jgi:signal transduction histidine kinase
MEMALSNLLDNALKFTPTGGQIEVGAKKDEDSAVVWVDDTGVGISAEDFPHIFKRFYRGREHQDEGSGLGLAIVESIVQAHGGEVQVESTPGEGAQFTIRLPLAAPTT